MRGIDVRRAARTRKAWNSGKHNTHEFVHRGRLHLTVLKRPYLIFHSFIASSFFSDSFHHVRLGYWSGHHLPQIRHQGLRIFESPHEVAPSAMRMLRFRLLYQTRCRSFLLDDSRYAFPSCHPWHPMPPKLVCERRMER